MTSDTTVVALHQPDAVEDPLTAVLRSGARRLLAQAVEAEAEAFLAEMRDLRLPDGRERLVRHGYGPERLGANRVWAGAWKRCCRSSTCAGCRWATSRRRWRPCWARRHRTCRRRRSRGYGTRGRPT